MFHIPKHSDNIKAKGKFQPIVVDPLDVCQMRVQREIKKGDKVYYKAPKIQRLITPARLKRKRIRKNKKLQRVKENQEKLKKWNLEYQRRLKELKMKKQKK